MLEKFRALMKQNMYSLLLNICKIYMAVGTGTGNF